MSNIEAAQDDLESIEEVKKRMVAEQKTSSITMKEVQDLMAKDKKEDDPAIVVAEAEKDTPKIDNQKVEVQKEVK